ncbi:MAG: aminopeptidase [Burkholderiales bacterium]|nr:aminopeptidase [Burkholderiales bacterium]
MRLIRGRALGLLAVAALLAGLALAGCASTAYLAQSVGGHLDIVRRARPLPDWIADPTTTPALRERLQRAQRIRDWAVAELALPDNRSYRRYAVLERTVAVWNVVAAPELSLELKTSCFPVVGCVGYRGYYAREAADALAAELRAEGWEVLVYGVPAYSTLGWTEWLGGDPLLSTFIHWPEGELARLVFHELAHQIVYARDDTVFNESYATAVERLGVERWLAGQAAAAARAEYEAFDARRRDFRALLRAARDDLDAVYTDAALDDDAKRAAKAARMSQLRDEYARTKAGHWGGFSGYDRWFEQANNAALGIQAAYDELVPAFERLFEREGRDFARLHAAVRELARLPAAERHATLNRLNAGE